MSNVTKTERVLQFVCAAIGAAWFIGRIPRIRAITATWSPHAQALLGTAEQLTLPTAFLGLTALHFFGSNKRPAQPKKKPATDVEATLQRFKERMDFFESVAELRPEVKERLGLPSEPAFSTPKKKKAGPTDPKPVGSPMKQLRVAVENGEAHLDLMDGKINLNQWATRV